MSTLAESSVPSNEPAATPAEAVYDPTQKQKSQAKTARIPIKIIPAERLKKPEWIRVKAAQPGSRFYDIKRILREHNCTRSAKKPLARISASASARARPRS